MGWVFQILVLVFTALLWWLARRDLSARANQAQMPAAEDWQQLLSTVEQLIVEFERRAVVAEQRIRAAEFQFREAEQRYQMHDPPSRPVADYAPAASAPPLEPPLTRPAEHLTPPDSRYAVIDAALAEGISDATEIAHRTGLARGEVELVLSLRGRRMA